ncbi:MAG: hypothetical protein H7144_01695 [Burkholderiales bacterium]|nr:hypothetical protein [Phycisphaerae bacterium]
MYQSDIGQQIRRRYDPQVGGLIEIEGKMFLQWDRFKLKRRQRNTKRELGQEQPVMLTHYVWPETMTLLNQFAADADNP